MLKNTKDDNDIGKKLLLSIACDLEILPLVCIVALLVHLGFNQPPLCSQPV